MRITAYDSSMFAALHRTHMEAFADHWGFQPSTPEKWAGRTVESEVFRPDLSRIAFDGDEMVVLRARERRRRRQPFTSRTSARGGRGAGRRIASALIAEVLAAATNDGKTEATLGVDADSPTGAVGVYERAGFAVRSRFVDYRREI